MDYEYEYLNTFFMIFWVILFFFTIIIERKHKNLELLNYSFAALVSFICGIAFANALYQVIIFSFCIIFFKILLNPYYKKVQKERIFENQITTFIGREAVVLKPIDPDTVGVIKFYSITWEAICGGNYTLEEGELVLITGRSGTNLIASKITH